MNDYRPEDIIQTAPDFERFRPNAGCIVLNNEGLIFYAERADIPGAWQLPQGGIDLGEEAETAAARELFEETGISAEQINLAGEYPDWLVYEVPSYTDMERDVVKGKYIGQAQRWFLYHFTDDEENIDLSRAHDKEFTNWRWASPAEILESVVAFRRPLYAEMFRYFNLTGE